ncbi:hypothetical protein KBZ08_13925 [Cyanobium sp. Candia 9D4]|uniref:hypothetical protein n=1 Tax=Cyanobium sp. Candia 9D4 TaxID=2823707 RepID=UPI0020CD9497|nr:hypothetical protein [Cyanobium sp. Candia 9D4]MCP9935008.1 hypothetical protein [Cyanobium sp. Candia 9D4]
MSLIELVTGSVVFLSAAGSSLQLWALAGAASMADQRQQERLEQAEVALARAEATLRGLAPSAGDCTTATAQLLQALAAQPLPPGLARQLEVSASGDGVVLRLAVAGEAEPRQRLYVPAAFGRCGPAPGGGGGPI